jgi:hypothetical protein
MFARQAAILIGVVAFGWAVGCTALFGSFENVDGDASLGDADDVGVEAGDAGGDQSSPLDTAPIGDVGPCVPWGSWGTCNVLPCCPTEGGSHCVEPKTGYFYCATGPGEGDAIPIVDSDYGCIPANGSTFGACNVMPCCDTDGGAHCVNESPPDAGFSGKCFPGDPPSDACSSFYPHHDPMYGAKWDSCLPSGVPGEPTTYSTALFDDEMAHVDAATPTGYTWGATSSVTCGTESCTQRQLTYDGGVGFAIWCTTGSMAGWFIGANPTSICPTTDSHGEWY